ncbi:hypothetical protein [Sandaracinobacteroides hominis]|uniref:hypothetical protein n=1 Tax=Sandaracinobacteroides hominis TaxID=2780086 RepID=UPI0018F5FE50|nr:hypothetical protein [Sandaracinobacteroides hominis]
MTTTDAELMGQSLVAARCGSMPSMKRLLPLLFLLTVAAAPANPAGEYRLTGVMEAAGAIELSPDGRFRYALAYGALDETAEGRWRLDGNKVLLTTDPKPKPPSFTVAESSPGKPGVFQLRLDNPKGQPIPNIAVLVTFANGQIDTAYTRMDPENDNWMEADIDADHIPVSMQFRIPVFDFHSDPIRIDVKRARRFRVVLDPQDLGVRDFNDWPLDVQGEMLLPEGSRGEGFKRVRD